MSKLFSTILLASWIYVECYSDRPKIWSSNGNFYLEPARDKNIYFRTNGVRSTLFLGGINLTNATSEGSLNQIWDVETFSHSTEDILRRIQALESEAVVSQDVFTRNVSDLTLSAYRLAARISSLQRQVDRWAGDHCQQYTCQNGGTCLNLVGDFHCLCPSNWEGRNCEVDVNECRTFAGTDLGCQNGACLNKPGTYECQCRTGWFGTHCTKRKMDCSEGGYEMCGHGTCVPVNSGDGIKCICDQGWTTNGSVACLTDVNECDVSLGPRCSTNPEVKCINLPGSFRCGQCPPGFEGDGYACYDVDECLSSNGGCSSMVSCHNTIGSRLCGACPSGYLGDGVTCKWKGSCNLDHGGCHPSALCIESSGLGVQCVCPQGMVGDGVGLHGCYVSTQNVTITCDNAPCGPQGRCHMLRYGYTCFCSRGFTGIHCDVKADVCKPNPCKNGGICRPDEATEQGVRCECKAQYKGTLCEERSHCGSILRAEEGSLVYPLATTSYTLKSKCAWIIRTVPEKVINMTFSRFNLDRSPDCNLGFLQIHDGRTTADPLIGRFCGNEAPKGGNIVSSQHNMYLWFLSNKPSSRDGFALHWRSVAPVCGGELNATVHGTISSPGTPGKYPPNRDCYWHLKTALNKKIELHFFQLDLETNNNCSFDYLAIYDGDIQATSSQLLEKYCSSTRPAPLLSTGPEIVIHFHSDANGSGKGFQMTYAPVEGIPGCGGVFGGSKGEVASPIHVDSYLNDVLCEYKIRSGPDTQIQLDFMLFDFVSSYSCNSHFLKIYDGPSSESPIMGTFCGKIDRKITLTSTSNDVFMVFRSRFVNREVFRISYKVICHYVIQGDNGVIKTPAYPFTYPVNRICEYLIETSPGKVIQLTFQDFAVESDALCQFDNVEVRDGFNENATLMGRFCGGRIPSLQPSSQNIMYIRFQSDMSQSGEGFYANFTTIDIECGGIYKKSMGTINHPSVGEKYKNQQTCIWMILLPVGSYIRLTWNRFQIEYSPSCKADYLELKTINDDSTNSSLGRYCGNDAPPNVTISSNSLILKFVSDLLVSSGGFSVTYTTLDRNDNCGGNYIQSHGTVYSPGWPGRYDRHLDCVWVIRVTTGQRIKLNITQFDVESPDFRTQKCADFLQIRNGPEATSPLIAEYCGEFSWKTVTSAANSMYMHFHSDFMVNGNGFKIEWDSTVTGCGGTFTGHRGSISSPNYPQKYAENSECFYRIATNQGSKISLTFADLQLERIACDDYVEIYDGRDAGSPILGRFCRPGQTRVIETSSNYAYIKFKSDFILTGRGFLLNYKAVCNNNITGKYGVIESLNYPSRYPVLNCSWVIKVPKGNKINATFTDFDLRTNRWFYPAYRPTTYHGVRHTSTLARRRNPYNSCNIDYVLIDEPNAINSSIRHCSLTNIHTPISTKGNSLQIELNVIKGSFVPQTHSGFKLEWVSYGCHGHIKKSSGSFNKTLSSSNQMECEWIIESPMGTNINLVFSKVYMLDTSNCTTDALEIYNGPTDNSPVLTKFCHDTPTVPSTSNYLLVKLIKNSFLKDVHFAASFNSSKSVCGGYMRVQSGVITSKNYPKNYDNNLNCVWTITVPNSHRVALEFTDVDLNNYDNSCEDSIKLYDDEDVLINNYRHMICDAPAQRYFISKSNVMKVQFSTNDIRVAKGFKAHFSMICGGVITTTDTSVGGVITNNKFSGQSNLSCVWTILAPNLEQKVFLTISYLSLPNANDRRTNDTCPNSYLRILDGDDENAPLIDEYCGRKAPAPIVSRGSALTVHLGTHDDGITGYFSAYYSTVATFCGGSLTSESGYIASPNYPSAYPRNADCEWRLKTSPGNKVAINIDMLDIGYSEECNEDYLEIREKDGAGRMLGLYCGRVIPVNITAASELYIKFHSGNVVDGRGFLIHYDFIHGNDINGLDSGEIASPLYPHPYDGSGEFWWRITSGGLVINIEIDELQIHTYSEDCDDNLSIYDGTDDEAMLLRKLCGVLHSKTEVIRTTSYTAYIKLTLNEANEGALFHLRWNKGDRDIEKLTGKPNCGNNSTTTIIPGRTQHFTSPNYPKHYDNDMKCEWVFKATHGRHLTIQFSLFDIEEREPCANSDYVSIFTSDVPADWKPLKEKICLKSEAQGVFNASTFLKITFTSDYVIGKTGFVALVKSQCGALLTDPSGEISTNESDFDFIYDRRPQRCDWKVKVHPGRRIQVHFVVFNITNDKNDCKTYVVLHNGDSLESPKLSDGKYCGYEHEELSVMLTSGNNLVVSYVTSQINPVQNIKMHYEEIKNNCGVISELEEDNNWEIITTPNYPNVPDPYIECNWIFNGPVGEILRVDFVERFDLYKDEDCTTEFVEIHDGPSALAPIKGRFCGSNPGTIKTTGNAVFINFVTKLSEPHNGFKANVSIDVCGGIVSSAEGELTSPGYPNMISLPPGTICEWLIIGEEERSLTIIPQDIDLPESESECATKVTIEEFEPVSNSNEVLKTYCSQTILDQSAVEASNNNVTVKLHVGTPSAYMSGRATGFRLSFKSLRFPCSGEIIMSEGYLTTPSYPRGSPITSCIWIVKVPDPTRRISLEILDSGKYNIYLSDGEYEQMILYKQNFDIATDNATYKSSGSIMTVDIRNFKGGPLRFKAKFTSFEAAVCGGYLTGKTGHLSSPDTNDPYICKWNYKANAYQVDAVDQYNTISISGYANSTDPHDILTIRSTIDPNGRFLVTIRNSKFSYSIPNNRLRFAVNKRSGKYFKFDLQWKLQRCGGTRHIGENSVDILNIPHPYNDTLDCVWHIKTDVDSSTKIKLEGSFKLNCDDEFIRIKRYDAMDGHLLGDYCKDKLQTKPLVVLYKNLLLEYHTKDPNSNNIKVVASTVNPVCGGRFIYPNQFSSPNFPRPYSSNLECQWVIRSNELGFRVSLEFFNRFAIEKSTNCTKDAVIIYDWKDGNYIEIARLCGRDLPPMFNSTYNRLKVVLRTDSDINLDGFQARWTHICGGTYNATKTQQYLYSPGYPYYHPSKTCHYKISSPNEKIIVKFETFKLEGYPGSCENDNLTISSPYFYGMFCGDEAPVLNTLTNEVDIVFNSDSNIQKFGFKMSYSIYSCGGQVTEPTVLSSGSLNNYNGNLNCTWVIQAPKNMFVLLNFVYFQLEQSYECSSDYVAVYEGPNTDLENRLAILCSVIKSSTIIHSKGNIMTVQFMTDMYITQEGFKINVQFSYGEAVGCGGNVNLTSSHTLKSPFIKSQTTYENFLTCKWNIVAPLDHVIKVSFSSFHIAPCSENQTAVSNQCDCDSLQIKDGINTDSLVINTYCGHTLPPETVTSRNTLGIILSTDGEINSSGFTANLVVLESICGRSSYNVSDSIQRVKSPGFDTGSIDRGIHCIYQFDAANPYETTHLHFNDFDLESGTKNTVCDRDKIVISSVSSPNSLSLGKDYIQWDNSPKLSYSVISYYNPFTNVSTPTQYIICGSKKSLDLYIKGSFTMNVITAPEDTSRRYKGFDVDVSRVGFCGRNFTGTFGKIVNNYDSAHNTRVSDCNTLITVPTNYTVSIYFNVIYSVSSLPGTYLDIYDGRTKSSRKIRKSYEVLSMNSDPFFSTGNTVLLHNHLVSKEGYVVYEISYVATNEGRGCGGYLFDSEGTVTSPLYPLVYRQMKTCEWELETPHGTRVALQFDTYLVGRNCDNNYLQLVDRGGTKLLNFCAEVPATFTSADNYVKIVFVTTRNNDGIAWVARFYSVL